MPLFLQRMDNVAERDGWRDNYSADPCPVTWRGGSGRDGQEQHSALRCACETFGVERLMLGTDWPMLPPEKLKHFVDYVAEALPGVTRSDPGRQRGRAAGHHGTSSRFVTRLVSSGSNSASTRMNAMRAAASDRLSHA